MATSRSVTNEKFSAVGSERSSFTPSSHRNNASAGTASPTAKLNESKQNIPRQIKRRCSMQSPSLIESNLEGSLPIVAKSMSFFCLLTYSTIYDIY